MFGRSFFGARYFGGRFFGDGPDAEAGAECGSLFGRRYFGSRYWGPHYFGTCPDAEAGGEVIAPVPAFNTGFRLVEHGLAYGETLELHFHLIPGVATGAIARVELIPGEASGEVGDILAIILAEAA